MLSSNLPFSRWEQIFGDAMTATEKEVQINMTGLVKREFQLSPE